MTINDISEVIRNRRATVGITQEALADAAGVSLHTIINLESGQGNPRLTTLLRVADILGLTLELKV